MNLRNKSYLLLSLLVIPSLSFASNQSNFKFSMNCGRGPCPDPEADKGWPVAMFYLSYYAILGLLLLYMALKVKPTLKLPSLSSGILLKFFDIRYGRCNRMQYLIIMLLFVPLVEFLSLYLPLLFTLLLQVISSYFIICIITRRLRDMNYSPRIIIILGTLLLCAVCFAVLGHSAITSFHEFYKIASLAIGIPTVISWVFLATILLFSVGDADDNKYGRVPVGLDFRPMVSDKAFFESKAEKSREFTDNKIDPLAPWRKDDGKNIENSAETKNSAEYSTERPSKGSPASRLFSFIFKFFLVSIGLYLSLAAAVAIYEWLVIST